MPTPETLERFIGLVEQNDHAEACEQFYTENSSMQENQAPPRVGREAHVANERKVMARAKSMESTCVRPVFVDYPINPRRLGRAISAAAGDCCSHPSRAAIP